MTSANPLLETESEETAQFLAPAVGRGPPTGEVGEHDTDNRIAIIAEYTKKIAAELTHASGSWMKISNHLLEARQKGIRGEQLKTLCKSVNLDYTTATKLIKVAESSRLQKYADQLAATDLWSTLHAITLLKDGEFREFAEAHLNAGEIALVTRAQVDGFSKRKKSKPVEPHLSIMPGKEALSSHHWDHLIRLYRDAQQNLGGSCQVKPGSGLTQHLKENPKWKMPE